MLRGILTLDHPAFVSCYPDNGADTTRSNCCNRVSEQYRKRKHTASEWALYLQQLRAWRCLFIVSCQLALVWFNVMLANDFVTINVPMLCIYQDPVESTSRYGPRLVAAGQHLPTRDHLACRFNLYRKT